MAGSGDVFGTAISGLMAFQRGLHTTSHNISNATTEGYSRQQVNFSTREPTLVGTNSIGNGVQASAVRRQHDGIVESRLNGYLSAFNYQDSVYEYATQLDELLADANASLGTSMQNFFGSVQTVADTPTSLAAREVMVAEGEELVSRFATLSEQFDSYNNQINSNIKISVGELSGLAESVAQLNVRIIEAGGVNGNFPPNDLLDERDLLVKKMSELVNVSTLSKADGSMDVFIGKGQPLVLGSTSSNIITQGNRYDAYDLEIAFDSGNGSPFDITDVVSGGKLGGLLNTRDDLLTRSDNTLGRLAVGLATSFNEQHRQGMDLEGDINTDFFITPDAEVSVSSLNTGSGGVTATITDVSQLGLSDYEMTFDGTDYTLRDTVSNVRTMIPGAGPYPYDTGLGFELDITAGAVAGDGFYISPLGRAASNIGNAITEGKDVAAAAAVATESLWSNLGDAAPRDLQVLDVTNPALLNDVTIRFTAANTYDVVDNTTATTLASSVAFTSGDVLSYNGWQVTLNGAPESSDEFTVSGNQGATGDNTNMLALGDLQQARILGNGTESFSDSYSKLVSDVGVATARSDQTRQAQETLLDQTSAQKASISGVNLDEEAANLLRYQQAYAAAAKVMTTANTVFQTLLDAVR